MDMIGAEALSVLDRASVTSSSMMTMCINTGASHYMFPYCNQFIDFTKINLEPIYIANKWMFMALGHGTLELSLPNEDGMTLLLLKDMLYAPEMALMLLSVP